MAARAEHDLIREIRALLPPHPSILVGPGDDCAVLRPEPGRDLLFTTDAAIEGVHFDLRWMDAETAGRRAMVANISDIAAMAGRPRWAVLALAFPPEVGETALGIVRGAARIAAAHGVAVAGGNLARSPAGISITIALVGDVEPGRAVLRSGARPGDELWVTGDLGSARAGLLAFQRGLAADPIAARLVTRFRTPDARVAEAAFLRDRATLHALIDLSDGLAGDIRHIAAESRVGATIDAVALPLDPALPPFARRLGLDPREIALAGGEDYELLLAAGPGTVDAVRPDFEARFGLRLTRIGTIDAGPGIRLADGRALEVGGFDHFT